jgi:hypothetical protein
VKLVCRDAAAEAVDAEARSGIIQIGRECVNTFFKIFSLDERNGYSADAPCCLVWTSKRDSVAGLEQGRYRLGPVPPGTEPRPQSQ